MGTKINATATRINGWWNVEFELGGREMGTQSRRFNQVDSMVKDAAALMTGESEASFTVEVRLNAPAYNALVGEYQQAAREAKEAEMRVASLSRKTVKVLREDGLSVKEVSALMGLSPQRISQLASV